MPIFRRPDLFRWLFFSRGYYYCSPPSWENFIVFLICLFREGRFFDSFWDSPFAALFFLVPLFFLCEKKEHFLMGDLFFAFLFLPFNSKNPTRFSASVGSTQIWLLDIFLGLVLFFFSWYQSQVGVSQVLSFYFTWYLSEPGWCEPGTFFFLSLVSGLGTKDPVLMVFQH